MYSCMYVCTLVVLLYMRITSMMVMLYEQFSLPIPVATAL